MGDWYLYMVCCADSTLYTGITKDVKKRLDEHNNSKLGARYTRARRPVTLAYQERHPSRSAVCRREAQVKKLSRLEKQQLIEEAALSSSQK